jgi:3-hydroxyacyl-CoA dehydrogenase
MFEREITHVAVVGTGVIGISWATLFLEKGLKVTATDIDKHAEHKLRKGIFLTAPKVSQDLLFFEENLDNAVRDAQFVQECSTERINLKQDLFQKLDAYTSPAVLLVSSSSGIMPSVFQAKAINQQRILLGHPFNPPYIIPLVEVCGGANTSPKAIAKTIDFYKSIGKRPIHLQREMEGHVANRLQAALWQEAFYLVQQGVVSVEDLDIAIAEGPGLRWALLGPFLNMHLAGGSEGIKHFLTHLGPPIESWIKSLGKVSIDNALINLLSKGVEDYINGKEIDQLTRERDDLLQQLKQLKNVSQGLDR